MKEFIANTGGRYAYSDDILNLQDLALSITSIFEGNEDFIISGCVYNPADNSLSSGYVWLGGKIRQFAGAQTVSLPYYLAALDSTDMVSYANEENKVGRKNYLCTGMQAAPETGVKFLAVSNTVGRLYDKFLGKYAILKSSPSSSQTIEKDLAVTGNFSAKTVTDQEHVVSGVDTNLRLKEIVNGGKNAGLIGLYNGDTLLSEIAINASGEIVISYQSQVIYRLVNLENVGWVVSVDNIQTKSVTAGVIQLTANMMSVLHPDKDDTLHINKFIGTGTPPNYFANTKVYDGRNVVVLEVSGKTHETQVHGDLVVDDSTTSSKGLQLVSSKIEMEALSDPSLLAPKTIEWISKRAYDAVTNKYSYNKYATIGFVDTASLALVIQNHIGDINLVTSGSINISGTLKIGGKAISTIYVSQTAYDTAIAKKVDKAEGMGLSQENFTSILKKKLEDMTSGDITTENPNGYAIASQVKDALALLMVKEQNLADVKDVAMSRANLSVYSRKEVDDKLAAKLDSKDKYAGQVFTADHKQKLEAIKYGNFAYVDLDDVSHALVDGLVTSKQVLQELNKKAPLLLSDYSSADLKTIRTNLGVVSDAENKQSFVAISQGFSQIIAYITDNTTKDVEKSKKSLREAIGAQGADDATNSFIRKDKYLQDLTFPADGADKIQKQKLICSTLNAAYAPDYQTKLTDTGWKQVSGQQQLYARQIGNIVSIQGIIQFTNTRTGNSVGTLPSSISAPAYSISRTYSQIADAKNNRGIEFAIQGGSTNLYVKQESYYATGTEFFSLTYMV